MGEQLVQLVGEQLVQLVGEQLVGKQLVQLLLFRGLIVSGQLLHQVERDVDAGQLIQLVGVERDEHIVQQVLYFIYRRGRRLLCMSGSRLLSCLLQFRTILCCTDTILFSTAGFLVSTGVG